MKKKILIAIICANLIFITPFTVVAKENKINNNMIARLNIEGLVSKIRVLLDKILERYGQIKIVNNLCNLINEVLEKISLFLFCALFGILVAIPLAIIMLIMFFSGLTNSYIGQAIFFALFSIFFIWDFNCNFITFPVDIFQSLPFNSISPLINKKIYTEFSENCSCLHE